MFSQYAELLLHVCDGNMKSYFFYMRLIAMLLLYSKRTFFFRLNVRSWRLKKAACVCLQRKAAWIALWTPLNRSCRKHSNRYWCCRWGGTADQTYTDRFITDHTCLYYDTPGGLLEATPNCCQHSGRWHQDRLCFLSCFTPLLESPSRSTEGQRQRCALQRRYRDTNQSFTRQINSIVWASYCV